MQSAGTNRGFQLSDQSEFQTTGNEECLFGLPSESGRTILTTHSTCNLLGVINPVIRTVTFFHIRGLFRNFPSATIILPATIHRFPELASSMLPHLVIPQSFRKSSSFRK